MSKLRIQETRSHIK